MKKAYILYFLAIGIFLSIANLNILSTHRLRVLLSLYNINHITVSNYWNFNRHLYPKNAEILQVLSTYYLSINATEHAKETLNATLCLLPDSSPNRPALLKAYQSLTDKHIPNCNEWYLLSSRFFVKFDSKGDVGIFQYF